MIKDIFHRLEKWIEIVDTKNYDEIMFSDSQEEENRWESPM